MTDADDADDQELLVYTPAQAEFLLRSQEQAADGIGRDVNACKTSKLANHFTYFGSNITSTESDVNIRLEKTETVIDRLSIIWKSDVSDKIKRGSFQVMAVSILQYECTIVTPLKCM